MSATSDDIKRQQIDLLYNAFKRSFADVSELTAEELQPMLEEERVVVVDVRSPKEQAVSMIPGAVTVRDFEADATAYRDATVVVCCTVGGRSGSYAKKLHQQGWKVFNLKGGILAWTHGGGALVNDDGPTRKVHVFRHKFDLAADGYDPVW